MASLKELKDRIGSVKSTQKITKAKQMVAAAKLRRAQAAAEAGFVWTEEALAEYVVDPKAYNDHHGWPAKTKMTYKLTKGGEDVELRVTELALLRRLVRVRSG